LWDVCEDEYKTEAEFITERISKENENMSAVLFSQSPRPIEN
jgi:hypothetical protein